LGNLRLIAVGVLLSASAFAVDHDEAQAAFCKYVTEQATAQRDLMRSPSVMVGPVQPSAGTAPQMVLGVTNSLADTKKASLTVKVARTTCALYTATTEAQQHIAYALASIEKDVLKHRLELIQQAADRLNAVAVDDAKLLQAQNATRPAIYYLESARFHLEISRTAALTGIASSYIPPLSDIPLSRLIRDKLEAEEANQKTATRLAKESGWDIKLSGGAHRQLGQFTPNTAKLGAFGEFSLTYDLGRHAADKHYDNSASAYIDWKASQFDDVARQGVILKKQIEDTIEIQLGQLKALLVHDADMEKQLQSLDGLDSSTALSFKNQLFADQTFLRVDIGELQFRLARLQQYLIDNF
jgi:hypothetical protein